MSLLQQVESSVVLKIKHFEDKLAEREEKETWVEYQAWSTDPNKVLLRAVDPKLTPWIVYERVD